MLQIFEEKTHSPTLELIEMWFEEVSSGHSLWSFLTAQLHALYCYSIRHMAIFTYQFRCDSSLFFCFIVFRNAIKASFLSESAGCCRETSFSGANSPHRKRHCVDGSEKDALFYRFWSTEITGCFNCHCCRWKQKKKKTHIVTAIFAEISFWSTCYAFLSNVNSFEFLCKNSRLRWHLITVLLLVSTWFSETIIFTARI